MFIVIKYLAVFLFGLFCGWILFGTYIEEDSEPEIEIAPTTLTTNRSPVFRAATSARPSKN